MGWLLLLMPALLLFPLWLDLLFLLLLPLLFLLSLLLHSFLSFIVVKEMLMLTHSTSSMLHPPLSKLLLSAGMLSPKSVRRCLKQQQGLFLPKNAYLCQSAKMFLIVLRSQFPDVLQKPHVRVYPSAPPGPCAMMRPGLYAGL